MSTILSRNERLYLQKQPTLTAIPNSSGTATLAGADAAAFIRARMNQRTASLVRRDKTGSRSGTPGKRGRQYGDWSIEASLVTGADHDPVYEAAFGKAHASDVYTLDDAIKFFTMWLYKDPSTADQRVAHGCVVNQIVWNLGQDVAEWTASGECRWVQGSKGFTGASAEHKASLSAFPAEPGSPATTGELIAGFTGSISANGSPLVGINSATITLRTGNQLKKNSFGVYLPIVAEGAERFVTISFNLDEDDTAAQEELREATRSKAQLDLNIEIGAEVGNIFEFDVMNVQLGEYDVDDSQLTTAVNFSEGRAFPSTSSAKDEFKMTRK